MKKAFLLSLFFCLLASYYGQNKFSSDMRLAMQSAQPNEKIQIIITLNEQFDLASFERKASSMPKDQRVSLGIEEMRAFSNHSQDGLIQLLSAEGSQVSDVCSHWLFNGITCKATPQVIYDLAERPEVASIELDSEMEVSPVTLSEAEIDRTVTGQWGLNQIHADEVWETYGYTGKNVVVAILDSGVCYNHVGLQGNMWDGYGEYPYHGYDFCSNVANPWDSYGRGTMVAGIVAGHATEYKTGVAPDALIMALKITENGTVNLNRITQAMEFAIQHGADVLLLSACMEGTAQNSVFMIIMMNLNACGIVAITSAGDAGQTAEVPYSIGTPSNCPSPWRNPDEILDGLHSANICVGAANQQDQKPFFSSIGPVNWGDYDGINCYPYSPGSFTEVGLIRPDVVAPGTNITSLSPNSNGNNNYNMFSNDFNGSTAYSAAHVAGVVALLLEADPNLMPAEIDRILETSTVKCEGMVHKNNYYGAGRVDALEAVNVLLSDIYAPADLFAAAYQKTIFLSWSSAISGAVSYDIYHNDEYLDHVTSTSYTYEASVAGTHIFYVIANSFYGEHSPKSNYASVFVEPDGPVVTNVSATVDDHEVTLTWESPSPLTALRFGEAETPGSMGMGNNNAQTYWAQRFQLVELIDYVDTRIDVVQIYLRVAGTYQFYIYDGNPNGTDQ